MRRELSVYVLHFSNASFSVGMLIVPGKTFVLIFKGEVCSFCECHLGELVK